MSIRLPSRYEDLDTAFRGRLKPNQPLIEKVKQAFVSMDVSGGIRFLPIFGKSGSGKTSAALEVGTHLPDLYVSQLPREAVEDPAYLKQAIENMRRLAKGRRLVAVIDQFEEVSVQRTAIPSNFVETLSLLDRSDLRNEKILFIWLTTSREFQNELAAATTRNKRILIDGTFEIEGILKNDWPSIIEETFQFHNQDKTLSDYQILEIDITELSETKKQLDLPSKLWVSGCRHM